MKKNIIDKIINEVEDVVSNYSISADYSVEEDTVIAKFSGSFTEMNTVKMTFLFNADDREVYFCSISEGYSKVIDLPEFWINFMSLLCDEKIRRKK